MPKPTLLQFLPTPKTGTIAISTLTNLKKELPGSFIENLFSHNGSLYFTILKLTPSINGTNMLYFFLNLFINVTISASNPKGIYARIFLGL